MNILISSLGLWPDIVEETLGLFNYASYDFYANHINGKIVSQLRTNLGFITGKEIDEVWLIATDKVHSDRSNSVYEDFVALQHKANLYGVKYRLFLLQGIQDIINGDDARAYHDLALRVVCHAHEKKQQGRVFISLACGRKTMSADLQDAAYCFGCDALFHVLGDKTVDALPLGLGPVARNEALRLETCFLDDEITKVSPQTDFLEEVEEQKRRAQYFFTTYYMEQDDRSNFHVLYTLPPSKIEKLKKEKFGVDPEKMQEELDYLRRLPKTDLHCHLGGVLNPSELIEVASTYSLEIENLKKSNVRYAIWLEELKKPLGALPVKQWARNLKNEMNVPIGFVVAPFILLYKDFPEELKSFIYGKRVNELQFHSIGITPYEALGDLQGSALLGYEPALRKTVQILLRNCKKENVKYLEVRCSPANYADGDFSVDKVLLAIMEELEACQEIESSVLIIVSRHGAFSKIEQSLSLIQQMRGNILFEKYFRGFDLAGAEDALQAKDLRGPFLRVMEDCYNITIHAGETMPNESIWQAVYHLNAERIGHGLTLRENPDLMCKFLERSIGIEMCPSSNYQIVGFRDNYYLSETAHLKTYPLAEYMTRELKVSINTDDPGISLTNQTQELLKAARLTEGGLSKWEIFQLLCNGFRQAFYPYEKKKKLIFKAESCLAEMIKNNQL